MVLRANWARGFLFTEFVQIILDTWQDSLVGGSANRKMFTYKGQQEQAKPILPYTE